MTIIIFIIILAVLIIAHEFGHYLIARLFKIRVDEFGIGLPPKAKTIGKRWGTKFTLNWLPFGGFVKIFGEDYEEVKNDEDYKKSFVSKAKWKQAFVLLAGPFANVLVAVILFAATFMIGIPSTVHDDMSRFYSDINLTIVEVGEDSSADLSGILAGDVVESLAVGGNNLEDLSPIGFSNFIKENQDETFLLTVKRGEEFLPVTLESQFNEETGTPLVGVALDYVGELKLPFFRGVYEGFTYTLYVGQQMVSMLADLLGGIFSGGADLSGVVGPIGIVELVGQSSEKGIAFILSFAALISVNLAIINLIPFPALDGGRLLFVVIESITRKRIKAKISGVVNMVGFSILILLMLIVTYKDIVRLVT
jgi:regulator of sigma E protease